MCIQFCEILFSTDLGTGYECNHWILGNQLVSYTRRMDLVRVGDQAEFLNSSLRAKHFGI